MLHSRLVRYLDVVAREGSFHAASEMLNVATSAISRQIAAYERELGLDLFERRARGLRLTAAGEVVLAHVRDTLGRHRGMISQLDDMRGLRAGSIRIATAAGLAAALLPRLSARFCRQHPKLEIAASVMPIDDIVEAVANGQVHLGLAFDAPPDPRITGLGSVNLTLGIVARPDHPFAGRSSLHLSDCAELDLVLPDESLTLRWLIDLAFTEASLVPRLRAASNSVDFLKQMVLEGVGVSILSATDILNEIQDGRLVHVPFAGHLLKRQTLKLIAASKGTLEPLPAAFAELIKQTLASELQQFASSP